MTAAITLAMAAPLAEAQTFERRRTLLDLFFGSDPPERSIYRPPLRDDPPWIEPPPPRSRKRPAQTTPSIVRVPARPLTPVETAAPAKIDNAQKILVIGDFFASAIGDGLAEAFRDAPGTMVEVRGNGSSGLVRDDYYDWRRQLPKLLDEVKPALVVIELGANDRQSITANGSEQRFGSDAWLEEYQRRIDALIKPVIERRIPLIWAGLPPVKSPGMATDLARFNGLYRSATERAGGEFIDLWDGFVDENGAFVLTGSDISGQQVRLRGPDGISMTAAGKRKMAFFLEKSARKLLGDMASPGLVRLEAPGQPEALSGASGEDDPNRRPPIRISDPALDGGDALLGGPGSAGVASAASSASVGRAGPVAAAAGGGGPARPPSPRDLLVTTGLLPDPPKGRLDDYRRQP